MGISRTLARNKTLRYGVPMMLLIIGGSFGLSEFAQIRYDAFKLRGKVDPALEERIKKNKVTLESEYEKLKDANFDDWKNIRGPRPWEEPESVQEQQR
ncbi:cytochrome c oxidase assembly protein COX16 homolog, mitochondrial [Sphaerodactylus townsendi]|uniref:cytochrome c oxidase assembly protein COX16 homolog, mitochondrial n=1 Tax=Sphaerodactylus townsendi TaxID=933632 RepID=UPI002025E7E1|nr:cytochrome c oxidase assembly protein COX16 homolog, mitochondrial [Sphaerodactylus townsendi]